MSKLMGARRIVRTTCSPSRSLTGGLRVFILLL
jgi:hypothetical protein